MNNPLSYFGLVDATINASEKDLPVLKLFWPSVRKNCSSDRQKLLKFEPEDQEFAKCLRSLEQFIQKVNRMLF